MFFIWNCLFLHIQILKPHICSKRPKNISLLILGRGKRRKDSIDYSIFDTETEYKNDDRFEDSVRKLSSVVNKGMPAAATAYVSNFFLFFILDFYICIFDAIIYHLEFFSFFKNIFLYIIRLQDVMHHTYSSSKTFF